MDAFASPSIRGETPGRGRLRILEAAATTLAIGFSLFNPLNRTDPRLDASWQAMLIHAHAAGLQFGRDIIFTWGPWGFLCSLTHLGRVEAGPILVWQVGGQLLIAFALVFLTRSLVAWRRAVFAVTLLAFHWLFQDTVYFVLVTLIAISGLMRQGPTLAGLVGWALLLGFLAQIKFTYFVVSSAAVLAGMACWVARGSWKRLWVIAAGYVAAVLAAWVLAGQELANFPAYVVRSLEVASGYGDAMGFDESQPLFLWGAGLALFCCVFVWRIWLTVPERPLAVAAASYLAFTLFVIWKESFIRADIVPLGGHVFGLFTCVLILGCALPGLLLGRQGPHWFDLAVLVCLAGIGCFDPDYYRMGPRIEWQRIYGNAVTLRRLGELPADWERSFDEASSAAALPRIQAAVGSGSVDVYDYTTGIALLNGMRLSARPMFQSYSAYAPALEEANLRHYQSARAPDFLLWRNEDVDGRYPGQDDAQLLVALPGHYEPLFKEGEYWLFRKLTPVSDTPPDRRLILSREVGLSEEVGLPEPLDHALWLRADPVPNALGRLRGFLYKPPLINITTTDDEGRRRLWRLVPRVARDGFILVPTLADGSDLALLEKGSTRARVKSFHFESPDGQGKFWGRVKVSVFQMPGLPLGSRVPD